MSVTDKPTGSLRHRLYQGETNFRFISLWRRWFLISGVVILIGILSLVFQGLNFGIDFEGGTSWEVTAPGVSVEATRDALGPTGQGDAQVQILGGRRLLVEAAPTGPEEQAKVTAALAKLAKTSASNVAIKSVGPSWGGEVTSKAQRALVFFFLAIALYISLRFEWKMAVAALAAVVHDILVTVGVYSLSGFEVTPATVIAFLTILGFSLYDTIVVFDKVDENTKGLAASGRLTYADTVNLSMNQVLMRSLNTSLVAILPILSVLVIGAGVLGAATLKDFGLALLIGLLTGAYSSIYVAAPVLALLKEREPRYRAIRQRLDARGGVGRGAVLTPAAAMAASGGMDGAGLGAEVPAGEARAPKAPTPPRPRQQSNRGAPRPRKRGRRR
ncbi:MAG TPA: protein translocase subunit SecF [Acidimicrobiales bacterium]|nr:protein translocase subunit SecF [Acidimicrobiales bacterium]